MKAFTDNEINDNFFQKNRRVFVCIVDGRDFVMPTPLRNKFYFEHIEGFTPENHYIWDDIHHIENLKLGQQWKLTDNTKVIRVQ